MGKVDAEGRREYSSRRGWIVGEIYRVGHVEVEVGGGRTLQEVDEEVDVKRLHILDLFHPVSIQASVSRN